MRRIYQRRSAQQKHLPTTLMSQHWSAIYKQLYWHFRARRETWQNTFSPKVINTYNVSTRSKDCIVQYKHFLFAELKLAYSSDEKEEQSFPDAGSTIVLSFDDYSPAANNWHVSILSAALTSCWDIFSEDTVNVTTVRATQALRSKENSDNLSPQHKIRSLFNARPRWLLACSAAQQAEQGCSETKPRIVVPKL